MNAIIAGIELANTLIYDGPNWGTSYYRLANVHHINGDIIDPLKTSKRTSMIHKSP